MRHTFLIGFMAAGKTTAGRALARRLGRPFIDLDDVITRAAGAAVPEVFAESGEAHFRLLESQALAEVVAGPPAVIATGGGAPCQPDNLALMRRAGLVVALDVPLETALARAGDPSARPLLGRPAAEVAALFRARQPVYRRAHAAVATDGRSPAEVAAACAALIEQAGALLPDDLLPGAVLVALGERTYPVVACAGVLDRLGELVRRVLPPHTTRVALVADAHTDPLYGARAAAALERAGLEVARVTVPAGEPSKSIDGYHALLECLIGAGLDRRSAVVALGGGVVGDLAGFAAATLYRGVPVVQVPTTLVAMTDAAIGGKTGVNLDAGKNLAGAFWQPRAVIADPGTLSSLPPREVAAAFGELVKYALLDGEDLFGAVGDLAARLRPGSGSAGASASGSAGAASASASTSASAAALSDVILRCAAIKAWIVSLDEREGEGRGLRALLNLGHTVGHAIEAAAGYGQLLHGEAVALGLLAACRVSAGLGLLTEPDLEARVARTLASAGLETDIDCWLRPEVLRHVGVDKKRTSGGVGFIALSHPGQASVVPVTLEKLNQILIPARSGT